MPLDQDIQFDPRTALLQAEIDTSKEIAKPPCILEVREHGADKRLLTLGNFSVIIGKAKARKTFLVGLFTGAIVKGELWGRFYGERPEEKPGILYFDTEQGDYDAQNSVKRIERMAGDLSAFRAFMLRPYTPTERKDIIEAALDDYGDRTCLCIIDGVADLVNSINDEAEASNVTSMLLRATKEYNLHIVTVLHQNKADNFATGWIGSYVTKKAEQVISVTKAENKSVSVVKNDYSRGGDFDDFCFEIDADGLPVEASFKDAKAVRSFDEPENAPF